MDYDFKKVKVGDRFEILVDRPNFSPLKKGDVVTFYEGVFSKGSIKVKSKGLESWWVKPSHLKPITPQIPEIEVGSVWVSDLSWLKNIKFTIVFYDERTVVYNRSDGERGSISTKVFLKDFKPKPPEPVSHEAIINLCSHGVYCYRLSKLPEESQYGFTIKLKWDTDGNVEVEKI